MSEEEPGLLGTLEQRIENLLLKYQEVIDEKTNLAAALHSETERVRELEKRLDLLAEDREKVKTRIDQLLHRLKAIDS